MPGAAGYVPRAVLKTVGQGGGGGTRRIAIRCRNWEGGHQFPSSENLAEFVEITNVDMAWLIIGVLREHHLT